MRICMSIITFGIESSDDVVSVIRKESLVIQNIRQHRSQSVDRDCPLMFVLIHLEVKGKKKNKNAHKLYDKAKRNVFKM